MGTKNCPETPRQKMINMMYLVLTAMLALNVAKEVVDAFEVVDAGLVQTVENSETKNLQVYSAFKTQNEQNPAKVGEWYNKAVKVKERSDSLVSYIENLKEILVEEADGKDFDIHHIKKKDNLNVVPLIMHNKKKAVELRSAFDEYKEFLFSLMAENNPDSLLINSIKRSLNTADPPNVAGENRTWESENFSQSLPLAAVVTILSKMQADVRNSEADMLNYLFSQIDAGTFKFNTIRAHIIPESNYVIEGGTYKAKIILAAYDTRENPVIKVNGKNVKVVNGIGQCELPATAPGDFDINAEVYFRTPDGYQMKKAEPTKYQVARPSLTISPTKMNVFYVGVDNPVSISVPGIPSDKIVPSIDHGKLVKKKDGWIVRVTNPRKKSKISVVADINGSQRKMGEMLFRVKPVPDPVAIVAESSGGIIDKQRLLIEEGVFANLKDFDFDLKFNVKGFSVITTNASGYVVEKKSNSARFTEEQKDLLSSLSTGKRIYFDNIVAKGGDGTVRKLNAISFKIK